MRRNWPAMLVVLPLLAGCGSTPPSTQYYTLSSVPAPSRIALGLGKAQPVQVGRVELPVALPLILGGLRANDERLNAIAAELAWRLRGHLVPRLVQGAANPKNRAKHRARLLKAVLRTGTVLDVDDHMAVLTLASDKNEAVRAAAAELILNLQDHRFREIGANDDRRRQAAAVRNAAQ